MVENLAEIERVGLQREGRSGTGKRFRADAARPLSGFQPAIDGRAFLVPMIPSPQPRAIIDG